MKNFILLSLAIFLFSSVAIAHGGHKAFFTIQESNSKVLLTVRMEENDIKKEIQFDEEGASSLELSIVNYLKERMSISFDEKEINFEFSSSYTSKGYIYLKFDTQVSLENVKKISMKNTCFEEFDHLYYNVFRLVYGTNDVTYKLSSDRNTISHKLN